MCQLMQRDIQSYVCVKSTLLSRFFCKVAEAVNIILNPGFAFGTGEHPTTKLCLLLLQSLIKGGEAFLDYGTGSGILAIAALKVKNLTPCLSLSQTNTIILFQVFYVSFVYCSFKICSLVLHHLLVLILTLKQ